MENKKKSILWSILALLALILLIVFGISLFGKKENPMVLASVQDNGTSEVVYGNTDNLSFMFTKESDAQGEVTYELVSQKNEDNKTVDYFKLVSDRDNQIKVDKKVNAGTYTLTIRVNAKGNNKYKPSSKDITYLYTVNKAKGKIDKIPEAIENLTYNGKTQKLIKPGETKTGKFLYKVNDGEWSDKIPEEKDAGIYTVYFKVEGDENHEDVKEGYLLSSIDNTNTASSYSSSYYRPRTTTYSSGFSLSGLIKTITDSSSISYRPTPVGNKPRTNVEYYYDGNIHSNGYNTPAGVIMTGLSYGTDVGNYRALYTPDLGHCWNDGSRDPVMVTLSIKKVNPSVEFVVPTLYYDGTSQNLIDSASVEGGTIVYSLDNRIYTIFIPRATKAGTYTVYYKILGDRNHNNLSGTVEATILKKPIIVPTSASEYTYNGLPHLVDLIDYDRSTMYIDTDSDILKIYAGEYYTRVLLRDPDNNEWETGTSDPALVKWIIKKAKGSITLKPHARDLTYTGNNQTLITSGLSLTGDIRYKLGEDGEYSYGLPKATNAGTYTVYYYSEGSGNYEPTAEESLVAEIKKAKAEIDLHPHALGIICDGEMHDLLIEGETSDGYFVYRFEDTEWSREIPQASEVGFYVVYYKVVGDDNHTDSNEYVLTSVISRERATFIDEPEPIEGLVYSGNYQALSTIGTTNDGTVVYSINDGEFSSELPQGLNAGTYKVTYKIDADEYHDDSYPKSFEVTIDKAFMDIEMPEDDYVYNRQPQGNPVIATGVDGKNIKVEYKTGLGQYSEVVPQYEDVKYDILGRVASRTVHFRANDDNHYEASGEYTITIQKKELDIPYIIEDKIEYTGETISPVIENYDFDYMTARGDESAVDVGKYTIRVELDDKWNTSWTSGSTANIRLHWSIEKASVKLVDPQAIEGLVYTGEAQELITSGEVEGGVLKYSLDGNHYSTEIPTGIYDGFYIVNYRVDADKNHVSLPPTEILALIDAAQMVVNAPDQEYVYDGEMHGEPITDVRTVAGSEFNVQYSENEEDFFTDVPTKTDAGTYTIYFLVGADHHYPFAESYNIIIEKADGVIETDPTANADLVYTAQSIELLNIPAESSTGTVMYSLDNETYSENLPSVTDAGDYTVYYYSKGDSNHNDTEVRTIDVFVERYKLDKPTIEGNEFDYDGEIHGPSVDNFNPFMVDVTEYKVDAGNYTLVCQIIDKTNYMWADGTDSDITYDWVINKVPAEIITYPQGIETTYNGLAQQLVVDGVVNGGSILYTLDGVNYVPAEQTTVVAAGQYGIMYKIVGDNNHLDSESDEYFVASSIARGTAEIITDPQAIENLVYNGNYQQLIIPGTSNLGSIKYSVNNGEYSETIPSGLDAGTYLISYMIEETDNYTGVAEQQFMVNIGVADNPLAPLYETITYSSIKGQPASLNIPNYLIPGVGDITYTIEDTQIKHFHINGDYIETDRTINKGDYAFTLRIDASGDLNHYPKTVYMNVLWTVEKEKNEALNSDIQVPNLNQVFEYVDTDNPVVSEFVKNNNNSLFEIIEDYVQVFDANGQLNLFKKSNEE